MGPSDSDIKQVQLDAHRNTLRHFRNDAEDNGFEPQVSFDETDKLVTKQIEKGPDAPVQESNAVAPSNVPAGVNTDPSDSPATQEPTRAELNDQAAAAGVEEPHKLPNKAAVQEAIDQAGPSQEASQS